jgi:hypothetical protein
MNESCGIIALSWRRVANLFQKNPKKVAGDGILYVNFKYQVYHFLTKQTWILHLFGSELG